MKESWGHVSVHLYHLILVSSSCGIELSKSLWYVSPCDCRSSGDDAVSCGGSSPIRWSMHPLMRQLVG